MNPSPSRLYRENLSQSQPYVVPAADSEEVRKTLALNHQITQSLSTIQSYRDKLSVAVMKRDLVGQSTLKGQLVIPEETYRILLTRQTQLQIDTLSDNPYFDKYDVASDSRNIVRELRGSVSEDVVDRGVAQSQKLIRRELESRWLPANYAENQGIDSLSAYELMRPRMNKQEKIYW